MEQLARLPALESLDLGYTGVRDPGVAALKEVMPVPVVGLTEAALASACLLGQRFSIIAISQRIQAWYRDVVQANGLSARLRSIRMVVASLRCRCGDDSFGTSSRSPPGGYSPARPSCL